MKSEDATSKPEGQLAPAPTWITIGEAAERARCSKKVLYRAAAAGTLKAAKLAGTGPYRFRVAWVDEWLEGASTPVEIRR